jgi:hypothetical protein
LDRRSKAHRLTVHGGSEIEEDHMHDDPDVRRSVRKYLDDGNSPHMTLGRTDKYSGGVMAPPVIRNLADFGGGKDANKAEEDLVRQAFAAFRETYLAGLKKLVGDNAKQEPEAEPAPKARPLPRPQAAAPAAAPPSKSLATSEVI